MSANKNVRVCVAISPGLLLIEVDADRAGRKATGLLARRGPNIIRPPPLRSRARQAEPRRGKIADQRAPGRAAAG